MNDQRLSEIIDRALAERQQMKADGLDPAQIEHAFEQVVRQSWPFAREWKYLCQDCEDTGLCIWVCRRGARCLGISTRTDGPRERPGKYRRLCAQFPDSDYEHTLGEPCSCSAGARFRPVAVTEFDALDRAATQPKKPSRFGNR